MSTATQKIQLDIAVRVQGLAQAKNLQDAMQRTHRLADEVRKNSSALEVTNFRQIKSWDQLRASLEHVERQYDAVFRAGVHLHQLGNQLMGISETIIGTGKELVETYGDYDLMLRRAAVALNTNVEWQEKLDDAIQKTAIDIGLFDPEEVAEAYYIWGAAAGVVVDTQEELNDITAVVKDTMIATAMAGGNLESNLKGVFGILSVFNMEMSEAQTIIHTLALMTERTAADFGDLTSAFSYVGPLAASIGVEFDTVAQVLGVLADAGQRGSRAGRGLSMIFEGLANRSGPANEELTALIQRVHGLDAEFEDIIFPEGEFIGMTGLINEMAKGVRGLTDVERARFYATSFTNNASRAFIPLIEEQIILWEQQAKAGEELTSVLGQQKYATEEAGAFFQIMSDMATSSINSMIGSLENAFFPVLQDLSLNIWAVAAPFIDTVKAMADTMHEWVEANPELVQLGAQIAAVAAIVIGVVGAFFALTGSLILLGAGIGVVLTSMGGIIMAFLTLGSVIGAVAAAVATNFGGLQDAFVNLAGSVTNLIDKIGKHMGDFRLGFVDGVSQAIPALNEAARLIAGAVNTIAGWIDTLAENEDFLRWAGRFAAAVGILLAAIGLLRLAGRIVSIFLGALWALSRIGALIKIIDGFALGIGRLIRTLGLLAVVKGIGGFIARITGLSAVAGMVSGALGRFGPVILGFAKFALRAFGIIGLAISLFTLAYETNFLGFRDFVNGVISWIVNEVPGIISGVVTWIQGVVGTIAGFFSQVWAQISPVLGAIWEPIGNLITRGIPALITKLGEFWANVSPIFAAIGDTANEVFNNVLIPAWDATIAKVGEFISTVAPILWEFVGTMVEIVSALVEMFFFPIVHNWEMIWGVIGMVVSGIVAIVFALVETVLNVIGPWIETLIRLIGIGWETISGIFRAALQIIENLIKLVFGSITNIWNAFQALASGDWDEFWRLIRKFFFEAGEAILGIIGGLIGGLWDLFTGGISFLWEMITGFLRGIVGLLPDWVQDWIDAGGDAIRGLWEGISGWVKQLWQNITGWLGDLWDGILGFFGIHSPSKKMASVGKDLVRGLWEGIQSLAGWVTDMIGDWVGDIWDNVITFWDNHSPSRRMMGVGEDIAAGLALGIARDRTAIKAMDRFNSGLADRAETGMGLVSSLFEGGTVQNEVSFAMDNEKVVRVEIDLTSSDGSVDDLTLDQLKQTMDAGLVRAVERMAEVMN